MGGCSNLREYALLAGWTTPQNRDLKGVTQNFCKPDKPKDDSLADQVMLAGWPTTNATDYKGPSQPLGRRPTGDNDLPSTAMLAGWATPRAEERNQQNSQDEYCALSKQALGATSASSPAPTGSTGGSALNPGMSRWLMGFPRSWQTCCPGWASWQTIQRRLRQWREKHAEPAE